MIKLDRKIAFFAASDNHLYSASNEEFGFQNMYRFKNCVNIFISKVCIVTDGVPKLENVTMFCYVAVCPLTGLLFK